MCTLRNTPDKPIHCIVWSKEMLFPLLFGAPEASDLNETIGGEAAAQVLSHFADVALGRGRISSQGHVCNRRHGFVCAAAQHLRDAGQASRTASPPLAQA